MTDPTPSFAFALELEKSHQAGTCKGPKDCPVCIELETSVAFVELLSAAEEMIEILRWLPKGPQHEALVKLVEAVAKANSAAFR